MRFCFRLLRIRRLAALLSAVQPVDKTLFKVSSSHACVYAYAEIRSYTISIRSDLLKIQRIKRKNIYKDLILY